MFLYYVFFFFFFQAEDGIRDKLVTGVQTCALPILTGVLGRISIPIRVGGTGEIIYSQAGTRRTCGARAENGSAISKGTEVVVTRYEKGIAYVRLWAEMAGDDNAAAEGGKFSEQAASGSGKAGA